MKLLSKTSVGLITALLAGLAIAPAASAHDRDWDRDGYGHGRGHGWGHYKHERYWDGYRWAPRTVVVREGYYAPPPPPVVYYPPAPVYYAQSYPARPAITIGVDIPPIIIPLR
jgi:hypothetical protein